MPQPPRSTAAATLAAVALAAVLTGCGDSGGARADDPAAITEPAGPSELATHDGHPCPDRLPDGHRDEDRGAGADDPAPAPPDLPTSGQPGVDAAWTCRYRPRESGGDGAGTTWGWVIDGAARRVDEGRLVPLGRHLADLRPAAADRICTMDLGPRWVLALSVSGDLTGVVVDDFGCRDVRLTDEPFETAPGEATRPGTVPGVLTGPDQLLPEVKRAHGD